MNGRWLFFTTVAALVGCGDAASGGTESGSRDAGPGPSTTADALCGVETQDDGSKLITCDDGTTAIVRDGTDGAQGAKGEPGPKGDPGKDGASCSVEDNGDGTKIITCTDGTKVTVADGAKGEPGPVPESACPMGVVDGDYTVENSIDAALIAGCTAISGKLTVAGVSKLSLPALTSVGALTASNNLALTHLGLTGLTTVGGDLLVRENPALTSLDLPALTTVGEDIIVSGSPMLTSLSLPMLSTVGGNFAALRMTALMSLDLPMLQTTNRLDLRELGLTSFSVPALEAMTDVLSVDLMPALVTLGLPSLEAAAYVYLQDNNALVSVSLPVLTTLTYALYVDSNSALTSLSLPALVTIGGCADCGDPNLVIRNNAKLPTGQANAILNGLVDFAGTSTISGNLP